MSAAADDGIDPRFMQAVRTLTAEFAISWTWNKKRLNVPAKKTCFPTKPNHFWTIVCCHERQYQWTIQIQVVVGRSLIRRFTNVVIARFYFG
jgi:hypothetical protein